MNSRKYYHITSQPNSIINSYTQILIKIAFKIFFSVIVLLKPFSEVEMQVFMQLFTEYCILGGMPAVVREYIEKGTFAGSLETQRQLLADYEEDIRKYADRKSVV